MSVDNANAMARATQAKVAPLNRSRASYLVSTILAGHSEGAG